MYNDLFQQVISDVTESNGIKDGINMLKELVNEGFDDPIKFINDFKKALEEVCVEEGVCYDCVEYTLPKNNRRIKKYDNTYEVEEVMDIVCGECGKKY